MTSGGLAAVSASAFAALYSAFGKYDVVHIHAEGPAFFSWLPKMFSKKVVVTIHGECEIIRGCHNRDKPSDGCKIGAPQKVIYQCSEDGVSDTIKPRLERYGADCRKIAFINEEVYNGLKADATRGC